VQMFRILLLCGLSSGLTSGVGLGQSNTVGSATVHGRVVDRSGVPVAGARVVVVAGATQAATDTDGHGEFSVAAPVGAGDLVVRASGSGEADGAAMAAEPRHVARGALGTELVVVLAPTAIAEQVTVTATRSGVEVGDSGRTMAALTAAQLQQYPALTLDERLQQEAGFQLFRRSAGWIQNPTSQGISLRGLGSTAASRTLVMAENAPLNDGFGGWIHWNELPPETIEAVTIASGGGSDLYGSSALGGVIDVVPGRPVAPLAALSVSEAGEDTTSASGRGDLVQKRGQGQWGELAAAQIFRTDGYILTAPAVRGAVDIPANVHFENGRVEIDRDLRMGAEQSRAFLVGNVLNEARGNGTPEQTNGTRLWRYLAGDDWNAGERLSGRVRLFGSDEAFRQTFSSQNAARTVDTLTRVVKDETQDLGASGDVSYHRAHMALIAGADARDIRATDAETPIVSNQPSGLEDTTARQRFVGGFGEALGEWHGWSGAGSVRVDGAENLAASTLNVMSAGAASRTPVGNRSEAIASPRLGLARRLGSQVTLHATAYRAFRTPTINELYRTGQVGQQTTLANASLVSERATGAEAGVNWTPRAGVLRLDGTYFWTEINRPVSAVTIATTATTVTELRENLGQIQSQGLEVQGHLGEGHAISLDFGYQYAHAVVTAFSAQSALVGTWIPEVPREMATAQLRAQSRRLGLLTLAARASGRAYDGSANTYELHSFFVLDAYGERSFAPKWVAFVSVQNLFNRQIDVARTPLLTLGTPFLAQGGVRFRWGGTAQ
jgi:outer membrane receptor protein involved in Fe transport